MTGKRNLKFRGEAVQLKHVTNRSVRKVDLNLECARVEITTRKWQRRDSLDQPGHISPTKEGAIVLEWDETVKM